MSKKFIIKLAFTSIVFLGGLYLFFWQRPLQRLEAAKDLLSKSSYHLDESTQVLAAPKEGYYKATTMLSELESNLFIGTKASNTLNLSLSNSINAFVENYALQFSALQAKAIQQIHNHFDSLKSNNPLDFASSDWYYTQKNHYKDMLNTGQPVIDSMGKQTLLSLAKSSELQNTCIEWQLFIDYTLKNSKDSTLTNLCNCAIPQLIGKELSVEYMSIFRAN